MQAMTIGLDLAKTVFIRRVRDVDASGRIMVLRRLCWDAVLRQR